MVLPTKYLVFNKYVWGNKPTSACQFKENINAFASSRGGFNLSLSLSLDVGQQTSAHVHLPSRAARLPEMLGNS